MTDFTMEELEHLEDGLYELFTKHDEDRKMCMKLDDIHNKIVKMRHELGSKKPVKHFTKQKPAHVPKPAHVKTEATKHPHRRK